MTVWTGDPLAWPEGATLPSLLAEAAGGAPTRLALVDGESGETLSYAELAERVAQTATGLAATGLGAGDRLAILAGNGIPWVVAALAMQSLGGAVSGLNPMAPAPEVARQIAVLGPRAVVAVPALIEAVRNAVGTAIPVISLDALPLGRDRLPALARPESPAFLPFSSGTTGLPKAALIRQSNVVSAAAASTLALGVRPDDRFLGIAPMFHVVGPLVLAMGLLKRAAVALVPRPDPVLAIDIIERHRVSLLPLVPPLLKALAHHPAGEGRDFTSVRLAVCGGNTLPPGLEEAAGARLGAPVVQVFGMTEVVGSLTFGDPDHPVPGTVGRPMPGTAIRIADPETGSLLGPGKAGELQGRGPCAIDSYLGDEDATAALRTQDGWLRTGDLAEVDSDGRVWIRGRLKELIKVHAGQVPPAELEMLLATHPTVADAAVIGRPNRHTGEIPVAYVVWRTPADRFEVLEWLNEHVLPYKRVRAIETIDAIPRNPTGKILRRLLIEEDRQRVGLAA